MSLDEGIQNAVARGVRAALAPYLRRLSDPEPLVYSVHQAAKVLSTSTNTVRRLVEEGVLPTVPHMGHRVLIPRTAVARLVESATARSDETAGGEVTPLRQIDSAR